MTTNPTKQNDPKELWEIYEINDFIDAKDNQGDWRVGYIVDKNIVTKLFKIRFDGWSSKYDQIFRFNSSKLLDFRAIIVGYTGQKKHAGIRSDWKFVLDDHHNRIQQLRDFIAHKHQKSAREINQFIRGHNYFYTDFLMTKTYDSLETMTAVMQFFKLNIHYCVSYLRQIDPQFTQYYRSQQEPEQSHLISTESALANAFYEILDTMFIISGGYPRLSNFYENAAMIKKYLNIDFEKNVKRYYQLFVVQEFMGKNGFDILQDLIGNKLEKSKNIIPFLFLKSLASLYFTLSNHLSYQDKNPWVQKLVQITKDNLSKLNEKNIKDVNKSHVTDLLDSIKNLFDDDEEKKDDIEVWALETEIKFCKLMIICPFFQKKLKGVIGLNQIAQKNKIHPNAKQFVTLILKHEIFECLFSSDNAQIIKKSVEFCKNLFYMDVFPKEEIYRIWKMRIGKHEAALHQIYSLMTIVPSKVTDQKFNLQLFEELSKIKQEQWDQDYINMIKEYTWSAIGWIISGQTVSSTYGFDILYSYLLMKKNQFALTSFIQVLQRLQKTQIMTNFVTTCFKNINEDNQSHTHIEIVLKIISEHIFNFKESQEDFTLPIINDIIKHSLQSCEVMSKKFELLAQICRLTSTNILYDQFIMLWNEFKNKESRPVFFDWVLKKKTTGKTGINTKIASDIRQQIFITIWNEDYDYSQMDEKQSEIFIEFFKEVNAIKGLLKRLHVIIKVQRPHLQHIDKIWIALQNCSNQKIVKRLADLIAELYMNPLKINESAKQSWVKQLISTVSEKLKDAYKINNIDKINKFLQILKMIIERDQHNFNIQSNKYSAVKDYIVINKQSKQQKTIRFSTGGLCYNFKKLAAEKFKIPFLKCRIVSRTEVIRYENYFKSLAQTFGITQSEFEIQQMEKQMPSIKECLNSQLNLFFELLGDQRLERNVWDIVSRLPIDQEFRLKIENSQKPGEEINDPSLYKQLYMLRVMGLMRQNWWRQFINGKGLNNLLTKFDRITTHTKIERQYLKKLLEGINKCLNIDKNYDNVNFEKLVLDLFNTLHSFLRKIDQEQNEEKFSSNSIELVITSLIFKVCASIPKEINIVGILLEKMGQFEALLQLGLLNMGSCLIRGQFSKRMAMFNNAIQKQDSNPFFRILLDHLFKTIHQIHNSEQTFEYFKYVSNFIKSSQESAVNEYLKENVNLLQLVEQGLINSEHQKTIQTINYYLVGYLLLMKQLIKYASGLLKERITKFILYQCFFSHLEPKSLDNKCKSKESRGAALSLLRNIIVHGQKIDQSLNLLFDLHKNALWRTRKFQDWTLTPGDKLKSASGYVGLKNLGCTCYMNSFFQQIYMIPEFRQAIIECQDPLEGKQQQNENVLYQVKKMFFNLSESERKYYLPNQFCNAFKNYEGQPTNVHEQMDIDEFSGILFDRLENQMKQTPYQNVVKDFFGGVFSNQIICKGCPHFSQTEQSFLSVSLSVKNKKNIYQSFDTMIKGDTLDGDNAYFCERCNKKVAAVKRVCLKQLPDHLIITLKRFEFDFQTMNKIKVNDYCQFPIDLNVKQYSQQFLRKQQNPDKFDEEDALPDTYYEYVLKGVAIHIGYADSGHYYSYINQRNQNGKWFQFNDTMVRHFDIRKLAEQAFGGEYGTYEIKQKIKNAYMLIYERKQKTNDYSKYCKQQKTDLLRTPIYSKLSQQIHQENVQQKIESILFSEEYSNFAIELMNKCPDMDRQNAIQTLKCVIMIFLTVTIRQKDGQVPFKFLKKINPILVQYPEVYEWIVRILSPHSSITQFFRNNPAFDVKKLLICWFIQLAKLSTLETQLYAVDSLLAYCTINKENTYESCYILYELIKDKKICQYALQKNIIGRILQIYLNPANKNFDDVKGLNFKETIQQQIGKQIIIPKTPYELKRFKPVIENAFMWGILNRITKYLLSQKKARNQVMSDIEAEYMSLNSAKIAKALEQAFGKFQINNLTDYLVYLAYQNEQLSNQLSLLIRKGLAQFISKRYRQHFVLFKKLIQINDQLKQKRNRFGLTNVISALKANEKYVFDNNIIQQWIYKIVMKNKYLQRILISQKSSIDYLIYIAAKKIPSEDICRKNNAFLESSVNKYHGIKMFRSVKKYAQLSKQLQKYYQQLTPEMPLVDNEWDSDGDLTDVEIAKGEIMGYFDQKQAIDFIPVKVMDCYLNRLQMQDNNSKVYRIWKDDERLTFGTYKFVQQQSDQQIFFSDNTTESDQADQI